MSRRIIYKEVISALLLCFSITINAQESKSEQILNNLYDNFATSTFEEQYDQLKDLLVAAKAEKHNYNYNFALTNLSTYAHELKDYVSFTDYTEEAYQHWLSEPNLSRERIYYTATQAIALENTKGNTKKALELYYIMLDQLKKDTTTSEYLVEIYTNLAADSRAIGDIESAIQYNENAIETIELLNSKDPDSELLLGTIKSTQGHAYLDKKDFSQSISNYKQSIYHLDRYNDDFAQITKNQLLIESYLGLVDASLELNELDQAESVIDKLEALQKNVDYKRFQTFEMKGQYNINIGNYSAAEQFLTSALEKAKKTALTNKKFPIEARITMRLGDGEKRNKNLDSALEYYQDALRFIDTSNTENLLSNPIAKNVFYPKQALAILEKKASVAEALFQKDNSQEYFEIASNAYLSAVELLDKMKVNFLNEDTKYFIASNASKIYNAYIRLLSEQYSKSNNDDLISTIYMIAEKNKSTIAFDELQYKYALTNAQIPDELKKKHRDLKMDIAYSERLLSEQESAKDKNLPSIDKLKKKIFRLNEEFVTLDQKLNRDYAEEFSNREGLLKFPSMKEIQSHLDSKDLFVETFQSDSHYYLIAFDKVDNYLIEIPISEINNDLERYIDLVSSRPKTVLDEYHVFNDLSHKIYSVCIKPILDQFNNQKRILIVPDGLLNSIPFESLITDATDPLSFLINDLNITYLYAARQVLGKELKSKKIDVLSLGPQFSNSYSNIRSCNRDSLSSLPYAKKESEFLSRHFSGTFLNAGQVNKDDLLKNINTHQVIHIATHACVNEVDPMLNEIHFSDSYLTNREIENQLVSPELIVLGACNTANGKYIEGQGLLSLSKGFLQAGSKCIQASLWSIDDYASSEIIKGMFTHLKTGSTKSEALRHSKLSFLESADRLRAHPYFWAGIIQTGEDSPLFAKQYGLFSPKNLGIIFGGLIFLLGVYYVMKKRQA